MVRNFLSWSQVDNTLISFYMRSSQLCLQFSVAQTINTTDNCYISARLRHVNGSTFCFVFFFSQVWSRTSTSLWLERRASRRPYNLKCSESLHHVVKCLRLEHLCIELAVTHLGYFLKVASKKLISCVFLVFLVLQFLCWNLLLWRSHVQSGVLIKLSLGICSFFFQFLLYHGLVSVVPY